jgi:hypothetical protein
MRHQTPHQASEARLRWFESDPTGGVRNFHSLPWRPTPSSLTTIQCR